MINIVVPRGIRSTACKGPELLLGALTDQATTAGFTPLILINNTLDLQTLNCQLENLSFEKVFG